MIEIQIISIPEKGSLIPFPLRNRKIGDVIEVSNGIGHRYEKRGYARIFRYFHDYAQHKKCTTCGSKSQIGNHREYFDNYDDYKNRPTHIEGNKSKLETPPNQGEQINE